MTKSKLKLAAIGAMLMAAATLGSCDSKPAANTEAQTTAATEAAPVAAAAYHCPMGCEGSESNKPGKCPVCGMDLERNPDYKPAAGTATADSL